MRAGTGGDGLVPAGQVALRGRDLEDGRGAELDGDQGGESLSTARRETLGRLLRTYLQKEDAVRKLMADPDMTDELFVNFFAFHLDLPPLEKQTLLDADGLDARADALKDILEFKLSESQWPGGGSGGNDRVH